MPISEELKDAIRNSGKSALQIARETGIPQPTLSRFISSDPKQHRDIRLERTADKLAAYFGLELATQCQTRAENWAATRALGGNCASVPHTPGDLACTLTPH